MVRNDAGESARALRYVGVGFQFLAEAAIVAALGWWGDRKLDTAPWLLVLGTMGGVVLATTSLIRSLSALERLERQDKTPKGGSPSP